MISFLSDLYFRRLFGLVSAHLPNKIWTQYPRLDWVCPAEWCNVATGRTTSTSCWSSFQGNGIYHVFCYTLYHSKQSHRYEHSGIFLMKKTTKKKITNIFVIISLFVLQIYDIPLLLDPKKILNVYSTFFEWDNKISKTF